MGKPLVSIIVTCHNRRDYLEKTMDSVFVQHYEPVEIVVMDDGSTDGTDALMAGYGDKVRYFRQEAQGVAVARTHASRLARGEYIAYQDDDDIMPPGRISHLYEALLQFPSAVLATGDYALIDAEGRLIGTRWLPGPLDNVGPPRLMEDGQAAILWPKVPAVPHTTLFRRVDGERVGWFDAEFRYACSDADFLARLARLGPVVYVPEVVSYYRRGHAAIWKNELRATISQLQLWDKHLALIGKDRRDLRKRLQVRIRNALKKVARARSRGLSVDDPLLEVYARKAFSHLSLKDKAMYGWYSAIESPVRAAVNRRTAARK